jgi:hypothetical protein
MKRPCSELKKEIEDDKKTIDYITKDLKDPKYQNPEQQKMLRFRLEGKREQLADEYRRYISNNCTSGTAINEYSAFIKLIKSISQVNLNEIKDDKDKIEKYMENMNKLEKMSKGIFSTIENSNDLEQQLVYVEFFFNELSENIQQSYSQNIVHVAMPFIKKLKSVCQFNISQNIPDDIDIIAWEKLNEKISDFMKEAMKYW